MNLAERNRIFLAKLQNLPEQKKKIILWSVVIILGIVMGFFWVRGTINNLSNINKVAQNIEIPQIDIPNINMPDIQFSEAQMPATQTAGWQTYTNDEYGFEFKYPDYASLEKNPSGTQWTLASEKLQPIFFVLNIIKTSDINTDNQQVLSDATVDGVKGKIIIIQTASPDECYSVYVGKGELTYAFENCQPDNITFNQILSTFKFTK